jgi:hypothetical protein
MESTFAHVTPNFELADTGVGSIFYPDRLTLVPGILPPSRTENNFSAKLSDRFYEGVCQPPLNPDVQWFIEVSLGTRFP